MFCASELRKSDSASCLPVSRNRMSPHEKYSAPHVNCIEIARRKQMRWQERGRSAQPGDDDAQQRHPPPDVFDDREPRDRAQRINRLVIAPSDDEPAIGEDQLVEAARIGDFNVVHNALAARKLELIAPQQAPVWCNATVGWGRCRRWRRVLRRDVGNAAERRLAPLMRVGCARFAR
jgi:hypothetical protein